MFTLAEFMIVASADNHPPMLDKPQYESWKSRMKLYIQGKDNGRIILNSVENGPIVWPTVVLENGTVRPKTYEELSNKEKFHADYDLKATNIFLQGLPPDVYALVNHHKVAKDIWDRVKLLMQGTSLSKQERECKLYDEFDKFSYVKVQVNTKFLNSLPPEWGKFVTDVKLARDLHTSNYDQLYAYLEQHEFPQIDAGLIVPTVLPGDDPITCMNKAMAFLLALFTPSYPSTNNQLRSSSNLRNQATVQDGRVTISKFKEDKVRMLSVQVHKEMLQPKRRSYAAWFKEKVLLVQAQAEGKELDEEQLAFLANPGVADAKAVLMANLSSCDSDVLSEANNESKSVNESLTTELDRYKERVKILEQRFNVDLSDREKFIDSQMDDMIQMKNTKFAAFETEIDTLK
ncbi:hypothetical protein Tco_0550519 [Tanacetum coccineum]